MIVVPLYPAGTPTLTGPLAAVVDCPQAAIPSTREVPTETRARNPRCPWLRRASSPSSMFEPMVVFCAWLISTAGPRAQSEINVGDTIAMNGCDGDGDSIGHR